MNMKCVEIYRWPHAVPYICDTCYGHALNKWCLVDGHGHAGNLPIDDCIYCIVEIYFNSMKVYFRGPFISWIILCNCSKDVAFIVVPWKMCVAIYASIFSHWTKYTCFTNTNTVTVHFPQWHMLQEGMNEWRHSRKSSIMSRIVFREVPLRVRVLHSHNYTASFAQ